MIGYSLAYGIAALALLAGVYVKGRLDGARGPEAELSRMHAEARSQSEHYNEVLRKLRMSHSVLARQRVQLEKELKSVVAKPYYAGRECLDADGVRLANDALAASSGRTAGSVCKADPAVGWTCEDSAGEAGEHSSNAQ